MKSTFLREMQERGFLNQCTDLEKLDAIISKKSISAYIGFDCTANSLHVGSLFTNNDFKIAPKTWTQANSSFGRGTTLIGDPSGKDTTRKILKKDIKNNISSIKKIF